MKNLHARIIAVLGIAAVGVAVIAAEHRPTVEPKLIRLKANGQTVAEVRVLGNVPGTIRADGEFAMRSDNTATVVTGTNGVVIKIGMITITAPEAELMTDAQ